MWIGRSAGKPREVEGFRQGLRELGYIEGQNIEVEYRFGEGKGDQLPDFAAELMRRPVDVFVVIGTPALRAVQQATTTIPIVSSSGDPVGSGFVASLARPGGNITGMAMMQDANSGLGGKWVELLKDTLPAMTRVGYLFNPDQEQSVRNVEQGERAAKTLGLVVRPFSVRRAEELESVIATMSREGVEALVVDPVSPAIAYQAQVAEQALKHRLPAISEQRAFVEGGGLMAFGASIFDVTRRLADYIDRILKGANARRSADRATDQVRADHQHEDGAGAGPRHPGIHPGPRRRGDRMSRRKFLASLVSASMAWPIAVCAQQPEMPVIGFLSGASANSFAHLVAAFHEGLKETGFVEGENVAIEYRWAEGKYDRLPAFAADLVNRQVAVILASGGDRPTLAAKAATSTIPIVFTGSDNAVKFGLVDSLSHPGGNATGISGFTSEVEAKKLDLLHELLPGPA